MKAAIGIALLLVAGAARMAFAADGADIPQVSTQPSENADTEESSILQNAHNDGGKRDYQGQILSNPEISDIGRANALTGGGGNTAVITQQGNANRSTIKQTGEDNYARQTQKGKANDIYLRQQGRHNRSDEKQVGDHNHKVKIQNGVREESTSEDQEKEGER